MVAVWERNTLGVTGRNRFCPDAVAGGHSLVSTKDFDRFATYWRTLQKASWAAIPLRSQFDPAQIVQILPYVYMLERKSPKNILVRVCGTALDQISGTSITGRNYLDVCPKEDRQLYAELTHQVLAKPCAALLERDVTFLNNKTFSLTSQGFPLADADGIPRYTVGLMIPNRTMRTNDMQNGTVLSSRLKKLTYIDVGFGVPPVQQDTHPTTKERE